MDGDGGVAEHGFGTSGGDAKRLAGFRVDDGILDRPESALDFLVIRFVVGDGGAKLGVPVDESLAAADLVGLEKTEERFSDGSNATWVEREAGPIPIARAAHFAQLAEDAFFIFILPRPDAFDERLATDVASGFLLLFEQPLFNDGLRADSGVIGARQPEGVVALHASPTNHNILNCIVERSVPGEAHL